ncbi:MAG: alpha-amylase family glycosyl hydrolase [Alkalibacterium sp.]|nr:alpha-amylase family glycosyl hydrolase [Alkalibacterium sp.]
MADYRSIWVIRLGTFDDFDRPVEEASRRGISLMLAYMVLNHTSTHHEWFQKALAGDKKYQDYYLLREAQRRTAAWPTNRESRFSGPAWSKSGRH